MRIRGDAEGELGHDERGEHSHGQKERVPSHLDFAVQYRPFDDPKQKQSHGTRLEHEDGPGLDCAEGERSEQE